MAEQEHKANREARIPWPDRWLLDAMRQQGHSAVDRLRPAHSAWESLEMAGATTQELLDVACALSGYSAADLSKVNKSSAALLSVTFARRYGVVPVREQGVMLEVATANPLAPHLERDLSFASARQIRLTIASPSAMAAAYERIYGGRASVAMPAARIEWVVKEGPLGPRSIPSRGSVVDALDRMIADALDQRASDVHFEPKDDDLLVRFRVDGVLHDVTRIGPDVAPLVMSRLKVLAGLDIADRRRPQDGRATTKFDGRVVDLRVSTLPLNDRLEKAVVRLLDAANATHGLGSLGFIPGEAHRFDQLLGQNEGMVLVTGPTGSGKTTTLYAAIEHSRSAETNIVTVEDPIEYHLAGINQVQVNEKAGLSFASALRSIVRQDPDIILVGEIRDAETAAIAVKAGLTGHLVLSTLHTIDAVSAIGRLADIGVEMGALSGALKGVVAQRLVRRLCEACCSSVTLAELPVTQQMLLMGRKTEKLRRAVGCEACRGTGYRGRMVVAEVLLVTDDLRSAIARRADRVELLELAKRGGMISMWEAGLRRVVEGLTALTEVLDNVPSPMAEATAEQGDVDAVVAKLLGRAPDAPAAAPEAATSPSPHVAPLQAPPAPSVRAQRSLPPDAPRVLLALDAREERRRVREALEDAGCAVIEAADGEAALTWARRFRPALVIAELVLPRLDGHALAQLLGEDGGPPCIAFTVQNDAEAVAWALECGFHAVVPAHSGPAALAAAARDALTATGRQIRLAI
ncbi:MAG: type II/IV secretion system protein [Gemmatimonadetes bacterium]|nr:type II/IV secretion system protein [Gemmatimonadota bacterium]